MGKETQSNETAGQIRKLQLVELDILKDFKKVCEEENLRFFMLGGTFLGAVRHKGFIPWDDDIDIGMPRPDYDRFLKIAQEKLSGGKTFKNFRLGNENTIYSSRIEDSSIKIEDTSALETKVRNAWIDIFPLDGMPNNPLIRKLHQIILLYRRMMLKYSVFSTFVNQDLSNRPAHEKLLINIGKIIKPDRFMNSEKCLIKLDKELRKNTYEDSENVVNFMGAYKFREMFPKDIYEEITLYEFENEKLPAPKDYDYVLSQLYGDYMQLPPEEDRNKHHSRVLDEKTQDSRDA